MSILLKISWRNVWRNPRRSWVLITAIAVGVFSFMGAIAFMDGFVFQMIDSAIDLQGGHIQMAARGYHENPTIRSYVADAPAVEQALDGVPGLHYAPLVTTPGMVNSAEQASGVVISGVDPAREAQVTTVAASLVEGSYLSAEGGANEVVIGAALAERLKVRLGEKIVLMASDLHNEVSAGAYRIVGLYRTSSTEFDKASVYVHLADARRLVGYTAQQASAFSLRLASGEELVPTLRRLQNRLQDSRLEILTWRDRFPMLVLMVDMYDYANILLVVVLFTAIAFTIINSFLMVIFERIREIGIMAANGVRPRQVRSMLYLEAVFTVLLGVGVGGAVALALIAYWTKVGLDLSSFSEGLGSFGIGAVVYPYLDPQHVGLGLVVIVVMVLLSVLYPAIKASRFEIVEAINYV